MPSTIEYRAMLSSMGQMRQWMISAGADVAWANDFCDGLLLRLIQPETSVKIHLWLHRDGEFQVNVDMGNNGAYTNDASDDPLKLIGEVLVRSMVRNSDECETRDSSQNEFDKTGV